MFGFSGPALPLLGLSVLICTCSRGRAVLPGLEQERTGPLRFLPTGPRLPVQPHLGELEGGLVFPSPPSGWVTSPALPSPSLIICQMGQNLPSLSTPLSLG